MTVPDSSFPSDSPAPENQAEISRRAFIKNATAVAAAGLVLGGLGTEAVAQTPAASAAPAAPAAAPTAAAPAANAAAGPELKVAIIGVGRQGLNLLSKALNIPGIRFTAVCDIWPFHGKRAVNLLGKYKQTATLYENYEDLLAKEQGLDAVIIGVPDWMHAPITVAALKAGIHVYCEKEMSNTLEGARSMVLAARESKKLLQIGHQRRSEPRYLHALKLLYNDKIVGKFTRCEGQWCRPVAQNEKWPKAEELSADVLKKYGYANMEQFVNWHWFKAYSGGPIADLGSHQIDIFNWFLKADPVAVMADGGNDYYPGREWYDNVQALYEYKLPTGTVRASYLLTNTNGYGDFWELFRGDQGTLQISENEKIGNFWKEPAAKTSTWEEQSEKTEVAGKEAYTLKIGETLDPSGKKSPEGQKLLSESKKPGWQLHLENFFTAIRDGGKTSLNCPSEEAYRTCVTVLKVNEALAQGRKLPFKPEDFKI
jgi:predicted dehydrogenase